MTSSATLPMVVTIDGPAASGKSTVARKLAKKLGFVHLNSGALYRVVGLRARELGIETDDESALAELASQIQFRFVLDSKGDTQLLVNGERIDDALRTEAAGVLASQVAVVPRVREVLTEVQRRVGRKNPIVVDGRDAGSVVFPAAQWKFYLDASPEIRARRRHAEAKDQSFETVAAELEQRDLRDSTRRLAPQIKAADAIRIDTSTLTVDAVVAELSRYLEKGRKEK